jgi:hypothetical protein
MGSEGHKPGPGDLQNARQASGLKAANRVKIWGILPYISVYR